MKNAYLKPLLEMIESVNKQVESEFKHLNEAQLNWKPNPKSWSVAENLSHIMTTNRQYDKIFSAAMNGNAASNIWQKIPGLPGFFGNMLKKGVHPDTPRKLKTAAAFEPTSSDLCANIVKEFLKHQKSLSATLEKLDAADHTKIISSPIANMIVYSLQDAITVIVTHEQRHVNQARQVMEMAEFPG